MSLQEGVVAATTTSALATSIAYLAFNAKDVFSMLNFNIIKAATALSLLVARTSSQQTNVCTVVPAPDGGDSAPAIIDAFSKCGENGRVIFTNDTYNVGSVMNTTGLCNCDVEIQGTLLVCHPPQVTTMLVVVY